VTIARFQYLVDSKGCTKTECGTKALVTYNAACQKSMCPEKKDCVDVCKSALSNSKNLAAVDLVEQPAELARKEEDSGLELFTYNYVLVSCFSGFGTDSMKSLNEYVVNQPTMALCEEQIPQGSTYGLNALDKAVTAANAKKNSS